MNVAERVALGVEWLDATLDRWWEQIDVDELDIASTCFCVLGQLCADYPGHEVINTPWPFDWFKRTTGASEVWLWDHGFTSRYGIYGELTDEWYRVISERQSSPHSRGGGGELIVSETERAFTTSGSGEPNSPVSVVETPDPNNAKGDR